METDRVPALFQKIEFRNLCACRVVKNIGKPDAGKLHVRFDEGGQGETCSLLYLGFIYLLLMSLMFSALKARFNAEREMARIDPLTGALNRRALLELATYEIARHSRHLHPISIAFIDLDNFKTVNDQMGHAEGDKVLCEVVATFGKSLRNTDVIARVGGDEFVVMLPETDEESARAVMKKLLENLLASMGRNNWPVTFSIGLITYETPLDSAEEMIAQVDHLMYLTKNMDKNGIIHHVKRDRPKNEVLNRQIP